MDKIWYRNPLKSEVIGRCDGDEITEWPRRTDKKYKAKKTQWYPAAYLVQRTIRRYVYPVYLVGETLVVVP